MKSWWTDRLTDQEWERRWDRGHVLTPWDRGWQDNSARRWVKRKYRGSGYYQWKEKIYERDMEEKWRMGGVRDWGKHMRISVAYWIQVQHLLWEYRVIPDRSFPGPLVTLERGLQWRYLVVTSPYSCVYSWNATYLLSYQWHPIMQHTNHMIFLQGMGYKTASRQPGLYATTIYGCKIPSLETMRHI